MRVQNALDDTWRQYLAPPYPVDLERQRGARRQADLEQPRRVLRQRHRLVGPGMCCSPRHRMPFFSRIQGSKCVSMTWRAISVRPDLLAAAEADAAAALRDGLGDGRGAVQRQRHRVLRPRAPHRRVQQRKQLPGVGPRTRPLSTSTLNLRIFDQVVITHHSLLIAHHPLIITRHPLLIFDQLVITQHPVIVFRSRHRAGSDISAAAAAAAAAAAGGSGTPRLADELRCTGDSMSGPALKNASSL